MFLIVFHEHAKIATENHKVDAKNMINYEPSLGSRVALISNR